MDFSSEACSILHPQGPGYDDNAESVTLGTNRSSFASFESSTLSRTLIVTPRTGEPVNSLRKSIVHHDGIVRLYGKIMDATQNRRRTTLG